MVLTPLDAAVTTIDFSDPIEIAQGTPQTDADGTRQATLGTTERVPPMNPASAG